MPPIWSSCMAIQQRVYSTDGSSLGLCSKGPGDATATHQQLGHMQRIRQHERRRYQYGIGDDRGSDLIVRTTPSVMVGVRGRAGHSRTLMISSSTRARGCWRVNPSRASSWALHCRCPKTSIPNSDQTTLGPASSTELAESIGSRVMAGYAPSALGLASHANVMCTPELSAAAVGGGQEGERSSQGQRPPGARQPHVLAWLNWVRSHAR
ncbi:hypothetical protein CONLIGDRAFT_477577 [Coniochaeta ligniaria NRRL 30616]|uniref:Uncharacterized protein n=1 Tax=Coniochaeta ligniaria NRRL 30616 TaxID=1408157 RepID=A0A1J7JG05_9PEZI|nr:hypothetical protein CONLIGDRAFT_477577 [Coniochaeta ligniaria NRRL 30616]